MNRMEVTLRNLAKAEDVPEHILTLVANCVEDWYLPGSTAGGIPEEEFIDRLCDRYLNAEGFDIDNLGTPATRKIMRHARAVRREMA